MTQDTNTQGQVPEALRSIQRFEVCDCIDDKHVPAVIPNPHGPWVRYEDHIAALAAGQATAAQQGAAYADAHGAIMGAAYDFRDDHISGSPNQKRSAHAALESAVTHALRASHGQAPAKTGNSVSAQAESVWRDADQIEKWSDRVQRAHPKSEPEFWPDALRVKYMADEISDLRAAIDAARKQGATK